MLKKFNVEERDSELSEASLQNTFSVGEQRGEASAVAVDDEEKEEEVQASEQNRLEIEEERNQTVELDEEEIEAQQPTKIQVTLPSVDNNVHEESSVASDPVNIKINRMELKIVRLVCSMYSFSESTCTFFRSHYVYP